MPSKKLKLKRFASVLLLPIMLWACSTSSQPETKAKVEIHPTTSNGIDLPLNEPKTYTEILNTGINPLLPPEHEFPTSFQYKNGCFGYAVGHIIEQRGQSFDPLVMEETIAKPRNELWTSEHIQNLANAYELEFKWHKEADTFFELLSQGEPVVVQYKYPLENGWVGHMVAAYSFDQEGAWVSESISAKRIRVPYEDIFDDTGQKTRYGFAQVLEN